MWQLHNPIISLLISTQSETIRTTRGNWYFQYSSHVFLGNYRFRWNKRHLKYRFSHSFIDYLVTKIWHLLKRAIRGEVSWCQVSLSWREKQREDNNVLSLWLDRPRRVWFCDKNRRVSRHRGRGVYFLTVILSIIHLGKTLNCYNTSELRSHGNSVVTC